MKIIMDLDKSELYKLVGYVYEDLLSGEHYRVEDVRNLLTLYDKFEKILNDKRHEGELLNE